MAPIYFPFTSLQLLFKSQHSVCLVVNQYFIVLISRIGKSDRVLAGIKVRKGLSDKIGE